MTTHDNLQLMQTLDDSWNNQDWDTFSKRHAENTVVFRQVNLNQHEAYMTTKQSVLRSLRRSQITI